MKVLFIGGTGVISEGVSRLAVERGIDLYLLNRGNRSALFPEGAHSIRGDIDQPREIAEALGKMHFDAVVDWIAFTPEQVRRDIELFRDRTDQYLFISSASAYQKPVGDYLITESTPLANPYWQYSRDKIACEEALLEEYRQNGFPVTIVRPSLTYGNTMIPVGVDCWKKPWTFIDRIRRGQKIIIHGDGTSLWVMTHNTDFAGGFLGLLGNGRAIGHAFHITSDEVLTWNQIYAAIGRAAGVEIRAVHIPSDFLAAVFPGGEGSLIGDKAQSVVFDNSKIKRFVPGFAATVPFAAGVKRSIAWFEAHPEYCVVDEEWNRLIDKIIAAYEGATNAAKSGF
ncbi:nucleoside-diphosphate-sugar epimerase [Hydrogenispora ethanolica]|jgi:nucleoside-diphosphate-sugar epimerase|uniref:Nucleoside-diphosphate-sugar epimerase n=1 Tax=Hydrogenispora ethanolica TaxID=1082276 RepID=A0A4R1QVA0_HYDET|nr:SDR family oxidoreductase [Hydrogenispora ethanolica]TCL57889.1 nucleoside-diphosphate-sugar epimerase [Hydrogenispora ethanolica]